MFWEWGMGTREGWRCLAKSAKGLGCESPLIVTEIQLVWLGEQLYLNILEQILTCSVTKDTAIYQLTAALLGSVDPPSVRGQIKVPVDCVLQELGTLPGLLRLEQCCSSWSSWTPAGAAVNSEAQHTPPHQSPLHPCSWMENRSFLDPPSRRSQSLRPQQRDQVQQGTFADEN